MDSLFKVGDRVKQIYPTYETGTVVRVDKPTLNPHCILVKMDGRISGEDIKVFQPSHIKLISKEKDNGHTNG